MRNAIKEVALVLWNIALFATWMTTLAICLLIAGALTGAIQ